MKCNYFIFLLVPLSFFAQKDSLNIGDYYADDQLYFSISYSQLINQPSGINKSNFSYSLSAGFLKDVILNTSGSWSFAGGIGYGFDSFSHNLNVNNTNNTTTFTNGNNLVDNTFNSHNLEFPIEFRWRSSTANTYKFWRVYGGLKFLYNFNNSFRSTDENGVIMSHTNSRSFNSWQHGLTLSAGYSRFNVNIFYSLTPLFKNATLDGVSIDTRTLKFGFIFYFL